MDSKELTREELLKAVFDLTDGKSWSDIMNETGFDVDRSKQLASIGYKAYEELKKLGLIQ